MTEYNLLSSHKGNVIIKVVEIGELKAGTGAKGDWTKKDAIVMDASGEQKLTLWNEDIAKIQQDKVYKLENPFWSEYEGKPQLQLGKYCKIHDATESDMLGSSHGGAPGEQAPKEYTSPAIQREPVSETDAIQFAEKCVASYIVICVGNKLTESDIAAGTSAVYNTALMQKMRR